MRFRAALVAAICVTATVVAAPAAGATTHRPDRAAAGWTARQFVDGDHLETTFDGTSYPDAGLTIDAVLAFAAARSADDYGAAALTWLARPDVLTGYLGDGGTEAYAGATAKTAFAAQVRGADPTAFGGVDLIARLGTLLTPSGRYSDRSVYGDYSNAFTQSFALLALDRTPAGAPTAAVDFTVGTQCADGGFPLYYGTPTCVSDADATAMVTQALLATGRHTAAQKGLTWLKSQQLSNGGVTGTGSGTANASTTGLAGQAFRAGGRILPAAKAAGFVLSLRVTCSAPAADRGAIAFDSTGFTPGTAVRATTQGILGFAGAPLATLSSAGSTTGAPTLACA
ncbi:peptidase [Actinokineospora auranticolor]|uniref:Prenyltransferase/squalene oxidase-like repeat protein n=1 Tax=Actinokineospora auranticolor TaxID=155976 RepID=A0A2S6GSU6_9PSEU|nr:peptidase [Actinokineospora auranticolor]PPK68328.1 hypothetical protein CLV40_10551 [Actinokineospora auranticolor]